MENLIQMLNLLGLWCFSIAICGLAVLLFWWFCSGNRRNNENQFEPDAEPDASLAHNPQAHDEDVEMSVAAEAEPQELQRREPNGEEDCQQTMVLAGSCTMKGSLSFMDFEVQ